MPIQPADFLAVAQGLAASSDECALRSATSRAYYAAYHACDAWHAGLPAPGSNQGPPGGKHQVLINQLKFPDSSLGVDRKQLSRFTSIKLDVMRQRRTQADYRLSDNPAAQETIDQITQVGDLLAKLV